MVTNRQLGKKSLGKGHCQGDGYAIMPRGHSVLIRLKRKAALPISCRLANHFLCACTIKTFLNKHNAHVWGDIMPTRLNIILIGSAALQMLSVVAVWSTTTILLIENY